MALSTGMWVLIAGALFAFLGLMLLLNHGKTVTIILGVLFLIGGGCAAKVGYDLDQESEVEYTVTEITAVTARDDNNNYRITLKTSAGTETWIYVTDDNLFRFPKDETIKMKKSDVKRYSEQN